MPYKSIHSRFIYCSNHFSQKHSAKTILWISFLSPSNIIIHVSPVTRRLDQFTFLYFLSLTPKETEWIMSQLLELFSLVPYSLSHPPLTPMPNDISLPIDKYSLFIIWCMPFQNFLSNMGLYCVRYMCVFIYTYFSLEVCLGDLPMSYHRNLL